MSTIFISYTSRDPEAQDLATRIMGWLRGWRFESLFRDQDAQGGVPAGSDWRHELHHKLGLCRAVIAICSQHYEASPWCNAEVAIALDRGKLIFPLQLGGCLPPLLVQHKQAITIKEPIALTDEAEADARERLRLGLEQHLHWRDRLPWDDKVSPFPGLQYFEAIHAPVFYGRDRAIELVQERLRHLAGSGSALLLLLGASGCGKSSLVRAGVLPQLKADPSRSWLLLEPFRPGRDPFQWLQRALDQAAGRPSPRTDTASEASEGKGPTLSAANVLQQLEALRVREGRQDATALLVVDQMEELLLGPSQGEEAGRGLEPQRADQFLELLRDLRRTGGGRLLILATLRSDFLAVLEQHPCGLVREADQLLVSPMQPEDYGQVIDGPAERMGLRLQPGLKERLVNDTGTGDALPLLAFTLKELWECRQRRGGPQTSANGDAWDFTLDDYEGLGGLAGSVQVAADKALASYSLSESDMSALRQAFVLHLVRVNDEGQFSRRPARWQELPEASVPILQRFVEERLVVSGREEGTLEVAHEALLRVWPLLVGWLEEAREVLLGSQQLEADLSQWQQARPADKPETLLSGLKLNKARVWLAEPSTLLRPDLRAYIEASAARARRNRNLAIGFGATVFTAITAASLIANHQRQLAMVREQMVLVQASLESTKGVEGLIRAIAITRPSTAELKTEVMDLLLRALQTSQETNMLNVKADAWSYLVAYSPNGPRIIHHTANSLRVLDAMSFKPVESSLQRAEDFTSHIGFGMGPVAYSSNGLRIVAVSRDSIKVWDVMSGRTIGSLVLGHGREVKSVAFSPDGSRVVYGSDDKTLQVWDILSRKVIGSPFKGHTSPVISVAWSNDGRRIASGSSDSVRVWDANNGKPIGSPLKGYDGTDWTIGFTPEGLRIVTGSYDGSLQLRDAESGEPMGSPLRGHTRLPFSVAFSPDGRSIVSGSRDSVRVWDTQTGSPISTVLHGHTNPVGSVKFSKDGRLIVSGSEDKTIRLWDAASGKLIGQPLKGHAGSVFSAAFSRDGRRIVSGSADKTVRVWDATSGKPIGNPFKGHSNGVIRVAYSPDDKHIVSTSWDKTLRLWDAASGKPIGRPFKGHTNGIFSAEFSPDGRRILSGSGDNTLRVWDVASGGIVGAPINLTMDATSGTSFSEAIWSSAYRPDGQHFVSGSQDNTLRIWNAKSSKQIRILHGHTGPVWSVAYSPDGRRIISGSEDSTVRVWNAETGKLIGSPLQGHTLDVYSVAYSPDGNRIVSSSKDQTVRVWEMDPQVWLTLACKRLRHHRLLLEPESLDVTQEFEGVARRARVVCARLGQLG